MIVADCAHTEHQIHHDRGRGRALSALPALASSSAPAPAASVATTLTITNPANDVWDHADAGVAVTLTATVTAADDTTPTGMVTFTPQNVAPYAAIECTATLVDGNAACNVTPPDGVVGIHPLPGHVHAYGRQ